MVDDEDQVFGNEHVPGGIHKQQDFLTHFIFLIE